MSLHVIYGLALPPIQNPDYAYALNHVQCAYQIPVVASRRVARIWKRGGLFWKSEKSANDLDPNFHCSWISFTRFVRIFRRNFSEIRRFFPPKIRRSPKKKKKKIFAEIETDFSAAEIRNSKVFSTQNQVVSKKKKKVLRRNCDWFFGQILGNSNVWGGAVFLWGGLFSIFHKKSASKALKTCDFAYFTSQWGGSSPPPPPLATLLVASKHCWRTFTNGCLQHCKAAKYTLHCF